MPIELITGRAGKAHIGSEDDRAYHAYTAGSGRYILNGGGARVASANSIHLNPAEILADGAHIRITGTGEDVSIDNGASSYKRIDVIALHYTRTGGESDYVETVELVAVKGTPADSDPQEPEMPKTGSLLDGVAETYFPLYSVLIDGLTPQEPKAKMGVYALPLSKGGTGATSAAAARNALGLGNTTGALPVANGGTGRTSLFGRSGLLSDLHRVPDDVPDYFSTFKSEWSEGTYTTKQALLKMIYPVGSIYISYNNTSPASLFGGTWTQITGRFPYFGSSTATGGANTQTLTIAQLPAHNHNLGGAPIMYKGAGKGNFGGVEGNDLQSASYGFNTENTGSGTSVNNMPAYQSLYAWRRTA